MTLIANRMNTFFCCWCCCFSSKQWNNKNLLTLKASNTQSKCTVNDFDFSLIRLYLVQRKFCWCFVLYFFSLIRFNQINSNCLFFFRYFNLELFRSLSIIFLWRIYCVCVLWLSWCGFILISSSSHFLLKNFILLEFFFYNS